MDNQTTIEKVEIEVPIGKKIDRESLQKGILKFIHDPDVLFQPFENYPPEVAEKGYRLDYGILPTKELRNAIEAYIKLIRLAKVVKDFYTSPDGYVPPTPFLAFNSPVLKMPTETAKDGFEEAYQDLYNTAEPVM